MAHRSLLRRHCASSPATVGRVLCSRVWCVGVSCVRRVGEAQRRQGEHPRRASRRGGAPQRTMRAGADSHVLPSQRTAVPRPLEVPPLPNEPRTDGR